MSALDRHLSPGELVDYPRGLADETSRASILSHVQVCDDCRAATEIFRSAAIVCPSALGITVPPSVERAARELFPRRGDSLSLLPRLFARLTFDSWLEPAAVGIRAAGRGARQGLFRSGRYCVDVRLERSSATGKESMVGQVADQLSPGGALPVASVRLDCDGKPTAQTSSNEFGEFQLEYLSARDLVLRIVLAETEIVVSLDGFGLED